MQASQARSPPAPKTRVRVARAAVGYQVLRLLEGGVEADDDGRRQLLARQPAIFDAAWRGSPPAAAGTRACSRRRPAPSRAGPGPAARPPRRGLAGPELAREPGYFCNRLLEAKRHLQAQGAKGDDAQALVFADRGGVAHRGQRLEEGGHADAILHPELQPELERPEGGAGSPALAPAR